MSSELTFKEAENTVDFLEIEKLAQTIYFEVYSDYINLDHIDYFLKSYQSAEAIQKQIAQQAFRYFLLQLNVSAIGYIGLQDEYPTLFLSKFYLLKKHRKKGLGFKAIKFIEKLAENGSYAQIELIVNINNKAAIRFYNRHGYKIVSEVENRFANGYTMQDLNLRKNLL